VNGQNCGVSGGGAVTGQKQRVLTTINPPDISSVLERIIRSTSTPHCALICQTLVPCFLNMKDLDNENITPLVMHI